ncbi:MAG: Hypoxanthine phosphoribosyltransferase [Phycisphaerae bacterium]|nr:Hypoxanthine phosphoribosyltransferase [Phycisphaerae bacterium]
MLQDIDRILFSREQIAARVHQLASEIAATFTDTTSGVTLVTILSGSIIFLADLIRNLPIRMKIGLVTVSSYKGATTTGTTPRLLKDLDLDIRGDHVLLIDDILDTGRTLRLVQNELQALQPASIHTGVLLRKSTAPADIHVDFVGFDVEDVFVVGYGLDYNDHYRNYPHIGVLRRELYQPQPDAAS